MVAGRSYVASGVWRKCIQSVFGVQVSADGWALIPSSAVDELAVRHVWQMRRSLSSLVRGEAVVRGMVCREPQDAGVIDTVVTMGDLFLCSVVFADGLTEARKNVGPCLLFHVIFHVVGGRVRGLVRGV